jgi:hypothetical protein
MPEIFTSSATGRHRGTFVSNTTSGRRSLGGASVRVTIPWESDLSYRVDLVVVND